MSGFRTAYDKLGRVTGENVRQFQGGVFDVQLDQKYNTAGNPTELKAGVQLGGTGGYTPDLINTYTYDNLSRMTQVTQDD